MLLIVAWQKYDAKFINREIHHFEIIRADSQHVMGKLIKNDIFQINGYNLNANSG